MKMRLVITVILVSLFLFLISGQAFAFDSDQRNSLSVASGINKAEADDKKELNNMNNPVNGINISAVQESEWSNIVSQQSLMSESVRSMLSTDVEKDFSIESILNADDSDKETMALGSIYETEDNYPMSSADNINLYYNVYGTITDVYYDMDYYRLQINNAGTLYILGKWLGEYSDWGWDDDLAIGLKDANGNSIGWCYYGETSSGSTYTDMEAYVTPGTYYIVVFQSSDYQYLYNDEPYSFITSMIDLSVMYNGNGNTGGAVPVDSTSYWQGDSVTVRSNTGSLTRTGYTFAGWNTSAGGNGTNYAPGASFVIGASDVTLYAKWSANSTYSVNYAGNGNTSGTVPLDGNKYSSGATVTVLGNSGSLARTGYTFVGWNTAANGSGTYYPAGATFTMGSANMTLYAQWVPAATYNVTYNGNGNNSGVVPIDSKAYIQGANVTVLGNTGSLIKAGYAFGGWNTKADGSGFNYAAGATFAMGTANVTLYAKWIDTQAIEDFITRFYQLCLDRNPDTVGLNYWVEKLVSGEQTGADIAQGFIFSQEFIDKNLSDDAFLDVMYQAFFNRAADSDGKNYWLSEIAAGKSRLYVLAQFVDSNEFTGICDDYGITKGSIDLSDEQIIAFVTRFYQLCLGREPDTGGLNDWVAKLKSGEMTGADLAQGFVFSNEFISKNLSNTDFVNVMYRVFFGREADSGGQTYWLSILTGGASRLSVLAGFVNSTEFAQICSDYGIEVGVINY